MQDRDAVVIGAGFAGMYMLHSLRQLGLDATVIERGSGVGGVWHWNRYPGARCDVESMSYSYSFSEELEQEWVWPHRYAMQPDILRYANHVADRFDLRRDIVFNETVVKAEYDETERRWLVSTGAGETFRCRYLVMATGCLSVPKVPDLPGLERFRGRVLHTADWPTEGHDFSGQTVGLIGTGSSGIQSMPIIASQAKQLTVFQRTANYSIPAWNGPLPAEHEAELKRRYRALRQKARESYAGDYADEYYASVLDLSPAEREVQFEKRWQEGGFNYQYAFADVMADERANDLAAEFVRNKIRATVKDPRVAEILCPKDHPFGSKRLCVDTEYFETYNRDNVTIVDIKADPIVEMTESGLCTSDGEYRFDTLVLATGFDAMTGALNAIDIRGRGGALLKEQWRDGPRSYLGVAVAGFPNMFTITGPGSPSVLANMILAGEQHVEWIAGFIAHAEANGFREIEAESEAQEQWARAVTESAAKTLYVRANSWYLGSNVPGKARVFMPYVNGFQVYAHACEDVAKSGYRGFRMS
ncbi:flavin-containing monooxygenase [Mesorhizobium amorphae]|uniref:Monooxygenase n=1 Tax=Mesorhizobium amorphae CCNWGS0123 TaxID=1082933 RepID=G6Y8F8_9HYPH|nr:NAD(P)/FAD-dependent oxidoreductase [Mesorhizobium amorphae]ANT54205.1 cyclohexanone monooxygenase [Mesorhizobium amorphae CCNWGS0123]EHH11979.1 monooxygenase [Mesorhizobium amorphae CCNWGS0123]